MSNESVTTGGLYEAVEDIGLLFYLGTPALDQKNNLIRNLILFSSIEKPEIIGLPLNNSQGSRRIQAS